jgi:hypothetical protein
MTPISESGAKTALLVPITIRASPFLILLNSSVLCPIDRDEWITAICSPNSLLNLVSICGVSDISGTSSIAVFPAVTALCISLIKTDVFPLPVMP